MTHCDMSQLSQLYVLHLKLIGVASGRNTQLGQSYVYKYAMQAECVHAGLRCLGQCNATTSIAAYV